MRNKSPPPENYQVPAPVDGRYLAAIVDIKEHPDCFQVFYEIAVGPSAGYGNYVFLKTGRWPLLQRIDKTSGQIVLRHLLTAAGSHGIEDAVGKRVCMELKRRTNALYGYQFCRSYPPDAYPIRPEDIRIGTETWAHGSPDYIHASVIAHRSGLPVLLADTREKESPMVDWCAEHRIAILPMFSRTGDYTAPGSRIVVDRKKDPLELYRNFRCSQEYASYGTAAAVAAAEGKRLVYVIGTSPEDHVSSLDDFSNWHGHVPGGKDVFGAVAAKNIQRYQWLYPNTSFVFVEQSRLCDEIYRQIIKGTPSGVPERRSI